MRRVEAELVLIYVECIDRLLGRIVQTDVEEELLAVTMTLEQSLAALQAAARFHAQQRP